MQIAEILKTQEYFRRFYKGILVCVFEQFVEENVKETLEKFPKEHFIKKSPEGFLKGFQDECLNKSFPVGIFKEINEKMIG